MAWETSSLINMMLGHLVSFYASSIFKPIVFLPVLILVIGQGDTRPCYPPNFIKTAYDFPVSTGPGADRWEVCSETIALWTLLGARQYSVILPDSMETSAQRRPPISATANFGTNSQLGNATLSRPAFFYPTNSNQVGWATLNYT